LQKYYPEMYLKIYFIILILMKVTTNYILLHNMNHGKNKYKKKHFFIKNIGNNSKYLHPYVRFLSYIIRD